VRARGGGGLGHEPPLASRDDHARGAAATGVLMSATPPRMVAQLSPRRPRLDAPAGSYVVASAFVQPDAVSAKSLIYL